MKFPYAVFPALPDAAFPNRRSVARPIVSVLLQKDGLSLSCYALIDSGADVCTFPASFAAQLGIAIPNPKTYVFSGTADQPQTAYFENVQATIWNRNTSEKPITFDLYAGFCDTLEHVGLGLLGQDGFFSRFKISMDRANTVFEVTPA
ncbi:MAG TPA: retropepsin-like aspartic protease [Terriglobales bacterium]|nr:retropepsin-like aspartic protease [Terriglobales bacterium]